jgi:hypothetical protein
MNNDTLKITNGSSYFDGICKDDSFFYAIATVTNNGSDYQSCISKFNYSLNIVSKSIYSDTSWMYGNFPFNSIDNKYNQLIIIPQITNSTYTSALSRIMAINKHNLDTIWTKIIQHPDTLIATQPNSGQYSVLTSIKSTPDGGYILTGNYNKNCVSGDMRSFLLKIDSIGNVEWRRTYNEYYTFFDIEIAQDSGYLVPSGLNGTNAIQLVKFDKYGDYEWKTRVMYNSLAGYPLSLSIQDSQYAITSSYYLYDTDNFYTGVNISKVDIYTKTLLWEKDFILYRTVENITLHEAMGVEVLLDGSIIVSGTLRQYGSDNRAFILKLNTNGDSLWTKTYNFRNTTTARCQLNDLMVCEDGGFLGVGYYAPHNSNMTAWLFKTDANGTIGFEKPVAELVEAKVFPNPAADFVTIEIPENLPQNAELKLYNALGQLVFQKSLNKGEKAIKLDLRVYKSGVYFFEVVGVDGVLGSGKFVRE